MSRPVFFRVESFYDLVDHAKRCPEVIYYRIREVEDGEEIMLIAGRFLWTGVIRRGSEEEKILENLLTEKGIMITEIVTMDRFLELI